METLKFTKARQSRLFDLSGRVALITGGSSGLGRVFCDAMAESGCNVILSYNTNEAGAEETRDIIGKYGVRTSVVKANVSKPAEIKEMFEKVSQEFGKLDVLFNNAGVNLETPRIHEMPLELWEELISTNLTSVFLCMQEGIKMMLPRQKGSIINISSICGLGGTRADIFDSSAYVTSKHGVTGLTKQVAASYAAENIRVNAIAPGFFPTRINRHIKMSEEEMRHFDESVSKLTLMGRRGVLDELRGAAIYLASDASSYVTGSTVVVDGGWSAW